MAELKTQSGETITDIQNIQKKLSPLGIQISNWTVGESKELRDHLACETLNENQKNFVLKSLNHYFEKLKNEAGYKSQDLIVLHPEIENLDELLAKFEPCHTHDDDEVRYIVDGEGVFGFVLPSKDQVELKVEAEEFINVPKNTEHWFHLTEKKRIKAVRYFSGTDGWVPNYTGTKKDFL